jgi:hypothetical protein
VSWDVPQCPHCEHLFDPADAFRRVGWEGRRDAEPHRGGLIDDLGTISMLAGILTLCTGPVGMLVCLATGIPALVMARKDLEAMRLGKVDPQGHGKTDMGRVKALVGIILMVLFGLFFVLYVLDSFR